MIKFLRKSKGEASGARLPVTVVVSFLSTDSEKDALSFARGWADRRFEDKDNAYVAAARFGGGFLWEAHEGGSGASYLPSVVEALTADPEVSVWVPSGDRVYEVILQDGKPLGLMLPSERQSEAMDSGVKAVAKGHMRPLRTKGLLLFSVGCVVAGLGAATLLAAVVQWGVYVAKDVPVRQTAITSMPHRQWAMTQSNKGTRRFVSKLEFTNGRWSVAEAEAPGPPPPSPPTPPSPQVPDVAPVPTPPPVPPVTPPPPTPSPAGKPAGTVQPGIAPISNGAKQ